MEARLREYPGLEQLMGSGKGGREQDGGPSAANRMVHVCVSVLIGSSMWYVMCLLLRRPWEVAVERARPAELLLTVGLCSHSLRLWRLSCLPWKSRLVSRAPCVGGREDMLTVCFFVSRAVL